MILLLGIVFIVMIPALKCYQRCMETHESYYDDDICDGYSGHDEDGSNCGLDADWKDEDGMEPMVGTGEWDADENRGATPLHILAHR